LVFVPITYPFIVVYRIQGESLPSWQTQFAYDSLFLPTIEHLNIVATDIKYKITFIALCFFAFGVARAFTAQVNDIPCKTRPSPGQIALSNRLIGEAL